MEGVILQCSARGAVRLGKEVCVHIPSFPTAAGERGGKEREGKEGEMNGKTVAWEAMETYARANLPIYRSPTLIENQMCGSVAEESPAPSVHCVITCAIL